MGCLVGKYGVNLTIGQACFIKAHVSTKVLGKKKVIFRMRQLIPTAIITDYILVLFAKCLTIETVTLGKNTDAHRRALNLILLKKRRTPH